MVGFLQQGHLRPVRIGDFNRARLDEIESLKQVSVGIDDLAFVIGFAGKSVRQVFKIGFRQHVIRMRGLQKLHDFGGVMHRSIPEKRLKKGAEGHSPRARYGEGPTRRPVRSLV